MRLLMLAIRFDRDDWATGFIPQWVERLAAHCTRLDVLALEVGRVGDLPANVRVFSMGKRAGVARWRVLMGFYRHALRLIPACDAVFVHMIPRYVLLAAPLALLWRKPITLWYTHRQASADLRRALPIVAQVLTAVPTSFPLASPKVRALGHGINPDFYTPNPSIAQQPLVIYVARLQAIKRQALLIEALTHLPHVRAVIVGDVPDGEDTAYPHSLRALAESLGVADRVIFTGGLNAEGARAWLWQASVAVNLSPVGLFDKAALESLACGLPTIVCNAAFADLMGSDASWLVLNDPPTAGALAQALDRALTLAPEARATLTARLREQTRHAHSLDALIAKLAESIRQTLAFAL